MVKKFIPISLNKDEIGYLITSTNPKLINFKSLWRTVKEREPLTPTYITFLRACYDIIRTNVNSISGSLPSQPSTPPIACLPEASFNHIERNNTKQYSSENEEPISFGLVEEPIFSELIEPIFPGLIEEPVFPELIEEPAFPELMEEPISSELVNTKEDNDCMDTMPILEPIFFENNNNENINEHLSEYDNKPFLLNFLSIFGLIDKDDYIFGGLNTKLRRNIIFMKANKTNDILDLRGYTFTLTKVANEKLLPQCFDDTTTGYFRCSNCSKIKVSETIKCATCKIKSGTIVLENKNHRPGCNEINFTDFFGFHLENLITQRCGGTILSPAAKYQEFREDIIKFSNSIGYPPSLILSFMKRYYHLRRRLFNRLNDKSEKEQFNIQLKTGFFPSLDSEEENFLGLYDESDIIIFSTDENLRILSKCKYITSDGTFYYTPKNFVQLYTIVGTFTSNDEEISIPLVYTLMKSKKESSYNKMLNWIFRKVEFLNCQMNVTHWYVDREQAVINSLKKFFDNPEIVSLCVFHYQRNIFNKLKDVGLFSVYIIEKKRMSLYFQKIQSLVQIYILPADRIIGKWQNIFLEIKQLAKDDELKSWTLVEEYFQKYWAVEEYAKMLSKYSEEILTTNLIESWHSSLSNYIYLGHNQVLSKFVKALQNLQLDTSTILRQTGKKKFEINTRKNIIYPGRKAASKYLPQRVQRMKEHERHLARIEYDKNRCSDAYPNKISSINQIKKYIIENEESSQNISKKIIDISTLEYRKQWINDVQIENYIMRSLVRRFPSTEMSSYILNTHISSAICFDPLNKNTLSLCEPGFQMIVNSGRLMYDWVFLVANTSGAFVSGVHWVLVSLYSPGKSIYYMDPLGSQKQFFSHEQFKKHFKNHLDIDNWNFYDVEGIPRQKNSFDCGVYVCLYVDNLLKNIPFDNWSINEDDILTVRRAIFNDC